MAKIPEVHLREYKGKNGKVVYEYYFYGPSVDGKKPQFTKRGFTTKKEALQEGTKARDNIYLTGVTNKKEKGDISVADFIMNVWFPAKRQAKKWQANTIRGYEKNIRIQIIPFIGKYPLKSVTVEMLQKMLDDMYDLRGYSHNSVSNLHGMICNIFKYAKEHDYITNMYITDLEVPKKDEDLEYELEMHRHQVRDVIPSDILDDIFERFPEGTTSHIPMMISLFTGARLGEAFGLTWDDIDFDNNMISINRQMQDYPNMYICNPKYNSKRKVPMCSYLKNLLLREKQRQEENKIKYQHTYVHNYLVRRPNTEVFRNKHGIYDIYTDYGESEVEFVNVYPDGKIVSPSVMKHASRIIHGYSSDPKKKKIKGTPIFDDFNMHSYRHTFASLLNAQDMDPMLLSSILGHKKKAKEGMAEITTTYVHLDDQYITKAKEYIERIYTPKTNFD